MAKLNNAYERGDLVEVERLIKAFGQDPSVHRQRRRRLAPRQSHSPDRAVKASAG